MHLKSSEILDEQISSVARQLESLYTSQTTDKDTSISKFQLFPDETHISNSASSMGYLEGTVAPSMGSSLSEIAREIFNVPSKHGYFNTFNDTPGNAQIHLNSAGLKDWTMTRLNNLCTLFNMDATAESIAAKNFLFILLREAGELSS